MIKIILFDCDGLIIKREKYFSQRLKESGLELNEQKISEFFRGEFLEIEKGKQDLKAVLAKTVKSWGFYGSVEQLMDFWFKGESSIDTQMELYIKRLRSAGVKGYLATNNEKYRTEYLWNVVGLKNFLDGVFSSCYLGFMKPEVEYWQEIYAVLNKYPKENILVWDDKQTAIDSARAFGFKAELYTTFGDFKKVMEEKYKI